MESYDSDDVQAFLTSFAVATSTGDLDAIAESYAFPALVVSGSGSEAVGEPETVRDAAQTAARGMRERGLVAAAALVEDVAEVGDSLVWARVRWSYRDENANERESGTARYLLRRARSTFEVCVEVRADDDR
ncbi:hypothetical protein [Cellulosimicrobium arenosum]|uniref:DUF6841 domain-containing protein n=1 Tax=Cellulosimicrobium arenosum TaxID=2708133 RepID=A0A927G6H3_9MICO|nr:hypothetical protein [Cellulosimicrobium arenosum]MBD8077630.1 hypothetical protein [Cellulosimicrobium arenosum]